MYHVPRAVITKYNPLGWLKTTELYSGIVLEAGGPKSRCQQGPAPSETG